MQHNTAKMTKVRKLKGKLNELFFILKDTLAVVRIDRNNLSPTQSTSAEGGLALFTRQSGNQVSVGIKYHIIKYTFSTNNWFRPIGRFIFLQNYIFIFLILHFLIIFLI